MVTTVVSSLRSTSVSLSAAEDYLLIEGVTHYTTSGIVLSAGAESQIFVNGQMVALDSNVIGVDGNSGVDIVVGPTGSISAPASFFAIVNIGDNSTVTNHGSIVAGAPIEADGTNFRLLNSGTMSANLVSSTSATVELNGTGAIITNDGLMESVSPSVIITNHSATIINSGTISGTQKAIEPWDSAILSV